MRGRWRLRVVIACAAAFAAVAAPIAVSAHSSRHHHRQRGAGTISHVLLISVDGLHQSDLDWYVHNHPSSALGKLASGGLEYTRARTPVPSDSFPGMVGQVTGGVPSVTGIYYDASYNHDLLAPGAASCAGQPGGTAVTYDESIDKDSTSIDAGQGLSGLPGSVLQMTAHRSR